MEDNNTTVVNHYGNTTVVTTSTINPRNGNLVNIHNTYTKCKPNYEGEEMYECSCYIQEYKKEREYLI